MIFVKTLSFQVSRGRAIFLEGASNFEAGWWLSPKPELGAVT